MDKYMQSIIKREAVNKAEQSGVVADSLAVRMALMNRVESGEITLQEAQSQLKNIKKNAKKNGMATRQSVWSNA
jgi:uncharacterized membrane protein YjjP (DUF1212 family)